MSKKTTKEFVKYEFSQEELKELSGNLALTITDRARLEDEKKAAVTGMNADIESKNSTINALAEKVQNEWEMRYLDCYIEKDYKKKTVSFIRVDNGELVKERSMSPDEFQMSLDEQKEQNEKKDNK